MRLHADASRLYLLPLTVMLPGASQGSNTVDRSL
jgi:hypothetical protein